MLSTFSLQNGIKVASYNLPQVRSIHLRLSSKCGSIVENPKNNGVAHFMEHILVQGIPSFPSSEELSEYVESLAGNYSAHTESMLIGFSLTVPSTHIENAVKISSEIFFEALFMEKPVEKERQVIIDEINQRQDSHFFKISRFLLETRFSKGHPMTLPVGGDPKGVSKLTRNQLVEFWKKYFIPKNTYLLAIGNCEPQKLKEYLDNYFGKYDEASDFPGYPKLSPADFSDRQIALRTDKKLSTCYLDITFPSLSLEADLKDRLIHRLALVILGQLRNSRLFRLLRYQKGLVYNVFASSSSVPGLGYTSVYSEVSKTNLDEVVDLIVKSLVVYTQNGPTEVELNFARNYLTNQWLMAFDHPTSIASWIEDDLLWEDKILLPEEYASLIAGVTIQDVVAVMQKYWDFSKLNLVIQGPIDTTEENYHKYLNLASELI